MSEEDFLKRWSRRKREAGDVARPDETETNADVDAGTAPANDIVKANAAIPEAEAAFDPASLPPVESITALSDATAFLRAGVPADLTRAALRRVWTVDPAIRDFVGLAENAWDFTDPNAMPGFGPLEATEDIRRMVAGIVDSIGEQTKRAAEDASMRSEASEDLNEFKEIGSERPEPEGSQVLPGPDSVRETPAQVMSGEVLLQSNNNDVAMQNDASGSSRKTKTNSAACPRQRVAGITKVIASDYCPAIDHNGR